MIKLKRLKINRYRNVEPCDLVFSDRFNILLGPNGAGKTTLLNLISKVLGTSLGDTSDPFSIEVELSFPGGTLNGKIESFDETKAHPAQSPTELRASRLTRPGASHAKHVPLFEIRVNHDSPRSTVTVTRSNKGITTLHDGRSVTNLPPTLFAETGLLGRTETVANALADVPATPIRTHTQNIARFDESLDTFRSITASQDDMTVVNPELRPQLFGVLSTENVSNKNFFITAADGIVPPGLVQLIESRFDPEATDISFNDGELDFLKKSCLLLGLRSSTAKLELIAKNSWSKELSVGYEYGNLKFWFTRKDGSIFQDQHLSYGQKRLLTFLYYLDANPSIVIADELVNGLHHAWIKECMEAIDERQAFLTSQNPLLLDYLFFESVDQVKESFILCRTEPVGDSEKMIWRNLTDDEAAMFYSAYKVGIEHVGEILRTRGLW